MPALTWAAVLAVFVFVFVAGFAWTLGAVLASALIGLLKGG